MKCSYLHMHSVCASHLNHEGQKWEQHCDREGVGKLQQWKWDTIATHTGEDNGTTTGHTCGLMLLQPTDDTAPTSETCKQYTDKASLHSQIA